MAKAKELRAYAGASWLQKEMDYARNLKIKLTPFHRDVADILGAAYCGIYHIHRPVIKANWNIDDMVVVIVGHELATWDGNELTILVVKSHEKNIRLAIEGASYRYLRLIFHKRKKWNGKCGMTQHPGLEEGIRRAKLYTAE